MSRISDARDVITTAREEIETMKSRIERAEKIYDDLSGQCKRPDTLTVTTYGDDEYVIVDDGADRWIAEKDSFVTALTSVLERCIEKGAYTDEDDSNARAYDDLCSDCPAMYSRMNGDGRRDQTTMLATLSETLDEDTVTEICDELGIETEETADAE